MDQQGRVYQILLANLSDHDRAMVERAKMAAAGDKKGPGKQDEAAAFKITPVLDRTKLPIINQGDLGQKSSDCVPSSFCNFLLWWDQENMLEIPKRGDFEAKAEWVHTKLAKYCGTRNTAGTSAAEASAGFVKYFKEEIGDLATLKFMEDHNLSPANLARYTIGSDATMLEMTTVKANGSENGHWVALISIEPDGRVIFNTWGARFEGVIKPLKESDKMIVINGQRVPSTTYEIHLSNRGMLPDWVNDGEIRFLLDPEKRDGVFVLRPYLFAEKGKKSPPPADPLFDESAK